VRKDLVAPEAGRLAGEQTFSFRHILIRDVAYRAMLKEVRADLHERYASWLEQAAGERASEHEEILGFHLARAYRYVAELGRADDSSRELAARAATRLGSSGQRALARGDFGPAAKLLDRAISLLPEDDPVRQDLALKLGIALAETGDLGRADALLHDRLAAERRGRAHLVFHDSAGKRHAVDLDEDSATTIGRLEESDVALSWDAKVSRQHAELRRLPEGWSLVDEGSSNGSLINGEPVRGRHPLRDGDVLRFGDTIVLFRAPVAEERPVVAVRPGEATTLGELPDDLGAPPEGDSVSR
jgi:FHA domain